MISEFPLYYSMFRNTILFHRLHQPQSIVQIVAILYADALVDFCTESVKQIRNFVGKVGIRERLHVIGAHRGHSDCKTMHLSFGHDCYDYKERTQ